MKARNECANPKHAPSLAHKQPIISLDNGVCYVKSQSFQVRVGNVF